MVCRVLFCGIAFGSSSARTSAKSFRGVISMWLVLYVGSLAFFLGASGHVRMIGSLGGDVSSSDDMFSLKNSDSEFLLIS